MSKVSSPVMIIGMHRSGTTLVCKLLQEMGCFMGFRKEMNEEATFFKRLNDAMLKRYRASWDHPSLFLPLHHDEKELQSLSREMAEKVELLSALEYWGPRFRKGIIAKFQYWGWKDPRMSIVLPVWLKVFPEATIIRVVRNGVDIAVSLWTREIELAKEKRKKRVLSTRCLSLQECYSLWCEYMDSEESLLTETDNKIFTIRYEDLLDNPRLVLSGLGTFLGLSFSNQVIERIKSSRKYAFLNNPDYLSFYKEVKDHSYMIKYGYNEILGPR